MATNRDVVQLLIEVLGKDQVDALAASNDKLKGALERASAASERAAGSTRDLGRSALEGSRVLQDFTQGGLAGILNNIEGLSRALGGGPGLAGLLTGVGVAAYIALPRIQGMFRALVDGSNEVPRATRPVEAFESQLKETTKTLDKLKEQQHLTNSELLQYNTLAANAAILTKQLDEARRREAEFKQLREKKRPEEEETAAEVAAAVGPDVDRLRREVTGGVTALGARTMAPGALGDLNRRLRMANTDMTEGAERRAERLRQQVQAERARLAAEADTQVQQALSGRPGGVERMLEYLPEGSDLRRRLAGTTPAARARWESQLDAHDEAMERAREAGEARRRRGRGVDQDLARSYEELEGSNREHAAAEARRRHDARADVRLGRQAGQRLEAAGRREAAIPAAGKAGIMPEAPTRIELQTEMIRNQQQMTADMQALRQLVQQARAVGHQARRLGHDTRRDLEQSAMPTGLQR